VELNPTSWADFATRVVPSEEKATYIVIIVVRPVATEIRRKYASLATKRRLPELSIRVHQRDLPSTYINNDIVYIFLKLITRFLEVFRDLELISYYFQ
jgi:hypothetical protein